MRKKWKRHAVLGYSWCLSASASDWRCWRGQPPGDEGNFDNSAGMSKEQVQGLPERTISFCGGGRRGLASRLRRRWRGLICGFNDNSTTKRMECKQHDLDHSAETPCNAFVGGCGYLPDIAARQPLGYCWHVQRTYIIKEDVKRYFPRGRPVLVFCIFKGHPVPPPHAVASRGFVSGRCNVPEVVPSLRV